MSTAIILFLQIVTRILNVYTELSGRCIVNRGKSNFVLSDTIW